MKTFPVDAPCDEEILEAAFAAEGLRITLKSTLLKYPGCVHWHLKQGDQSGTLEATLWRGKCWFSISMGRGAAWLELALERIKTALEADYERTANDS